MTGDSRKDSISSSEVVKGRTVNRPFLRSLSSQLMISHMMVALLIVLMIVTLLASSVGPLQRSLAYRRLADILQISIILNRSFIAQMPIEDAGPAGFGILPRLRQVRTQWSELLATQADLQEVRLVVVDGDTQQVLLDTENALVEQQWRNAIQPPRPLLRLNRPPTRPMEASTRGAVVLDKSIWYYRTSEPLGAPERNLILVALQERQPWRRALRTFLGELPRGVGWLAVGLLLLIMWLLSAGMARLFTRSLQPVITGTQAIAAGDLDYRVPAESTRLREIATLAQSFNYMAEQVQGSRQAQRDFLANVGHDLKTPLTGIQGFAQALMDGTAATPQAQMQSARIINDEARRLAKLVDDILDLARLDSDGLHLEKRPVDLGQQLDHLVEAYNARGQAQNISVSWEHPAQSLLIRADPNQLERVFTNLLDNAFTHTDPGGKVTISTEYHGDTLEIAVTDTGRGIPASDLERIFERFYQVNKSRSGRRGSGLGLSIVREIIEAHGGTVGVASVDGLGSRFWVRLPVE